MKRNYFFQSLLFVFLFIGTAQIRAQITVFNYTGSIQTYTVPIGVTHIQLEAYSAQGMYSKLCDGTTDEDGGLG